MYTNEMLVTLQASINVSKQISHNVLEIMGRK